MTALPPRVRRVANAALAAFLVALAAIASLAAGPAAADSPSVPRDRPSAACSAAEPSPMPTPLALGSDRWLVTASESAGMLRYSGGTFEARSDGTVWRDGCTAHLDARDRTTLARLVASAREENWAPAYGRPECCDQAAFTVEIERRRGATSTDRASRTYSATFVTAPADFRALFEALQTMTEPYSSLVRHRRSPSAR